MQIFVDADACPVVLSSAYSEVVVVGYTSGGAPYGVTWEEMGLKPWDDVEENNWVVSAISFISCDRNRFPFCLK